MKGQLQVTDEKGRESALSEIKYFLKKPNLQVFGLGSHLVQNYSLLVSPGAEISFTLFLGRISN